MKQNKYLAELIEVQTIKFAKEVCEQEYHCKDMTGIFLDNINLLLKK